MVEFISEATWAKIFVGRFLITSAILSLIMSIQIFYFMVIESFHLDYAILLFLGGANKCSQCSCVLFLYNQQRYLHFHFWSLVIWVFFYLVHLVKGLLILLVFSKYQLLVSFFSVFLFSTLFLLNNLYYFHSSAVGLTFGFNKVFIKHNNIFQVTMCHTLCYFTYTA